MNFILLQFFLITSVLFGGLLVSYLKTNYRKYTIKLTLAFSGGFLLAIVFCHLMPDLYEHHHETIGLYILIGFLVQLILEYLIGGIQMGRLQSKTKFSIPFTLFLALSIHSIIEGFPLGNAQGSHIAHLGHVHSSLFWGILFHQIPVAIALMSLFVDSNIGTRKSWLFLIIFALTTPFGAIIGLFVNPEDFGVDIHVVLAIVVGMFLHISTIIIFETSENHRINLLKLICILVGAGLAMLLP